MTDRIQIENSCAVVTCSRRKGTWDVRFQNESLGFKSARSYADIDGQRICTSDRTMRHTLKTKAIADRLGKGRRIIQRSRKPGLAADLETSLTLYDGVNAVVATARIRNRGRRPIRVDWLSAFHVQSAGSTCLDLGGDYDDDRVLVDSGCMGFTGVRKLNFSLVDRRFDREAFSGVFNDRVEGDNEHRSMGICAFFNPVSAGGFVVSFLSFNEARSEIRTAYGRGRVERISARSDFAGFDLQPGKSVCCDPLWIAPTRQPLDSLEEYAGRVRKYNRIRIKPNPVAWCSWYPKGYRDRITEAVVLANAKAIRKHLKGFPVTWIQIDLGWFDRNIPGEYKRANKRFPHGIKWMARELRKLGFELGLWYCPNVVTDSARFFKRTPQALLSDSNGNPAPRGLKPWTWEPHGQTYDVDPTHPEGRRFLTETFRDALARGSTYFKNDFLEQVARTYVEHYDKKVPKGYATYRRMLKIIRDTVGDKGFVLACSCLSNANAGLVDAALIAPDIGVDRSFQAYGHMRRTLTTSVNRWFMNRNFWINDPDALIFESCDIELARIRTTACALAGGQILLGDNMPARCKEPEFLKLFKICLPTYDRAARPVDLFENEYPRTWDLPVRTGFGQWHVTALMNLEERPDTLKVDFAKLGLNGKKTHLVWEFWEKRFVGLHKGEVSVRVPRTSTRLLSIREYAGHPDVLSTDMHVTQGAVEIEAMSWDKKQNVLSGTCSRPQGEKGTVFVFVPKGYRILGASANGRRTALRKAGQRITALDLAFARDTIEWSIRFA